MSASLKARLLSPVSSYRSKPGDAVEALVAPPACAEAHDELPPGTVLFGRVRNVRRVGLGIEHETARLRLDFYELRFPDGRVHGVETRLIGVDNARERVDRNGVIHGIRATASFSSRIGSRIAIEAFEHPLILGPALILESQLVRFPDPEIEYGRGTEVTVDVHLPDELQGLTACADSETAPSPELQDLVAQLPYWSFSKRQPQPMDLINLVFVGRQRELETAFAAAGWTGSHRNSMGAGLQVVRALMEEREYATAPMRTLLLDGDQPEFSYQTALNTFEKRDHLRIWKRRDDSQGREIWASAATRDIAATFSMGHPFGFTHEIQRNVDLEREKVVSDLELTGCVASVQYVDRPERVRAAGQEFRKGVHTDSRVAVIELNDCAEPRQDFATAEIDPQPNVAVRMVRRLTLTTRNHFMRDNLIWRSGDAARIGYLTLRHWYMQRHEERKEERIESQRSAQPKTVVAGAE